MQTAAVFVAFEGGEGSGKSTQIELLAESLRAGGRAVTVTFEPGATPIGRRIRQILLGTSPADDSPTEGRAGSGTRCDGTRCDDTGHDDTGHDDTRHDDMLDQRAEALLFAADRAHHVATVIRPALARGEIVLTDRFVDSSRAYQGAGRSLSGEDVVRLSDWATGGLRPDLSILLDVDPRVGLARAGRRGGGADRLEQEPLDFHDRVRRAFLDFAAAEPDRYHVLEAARPVDELAADVRVAVEHALDARTTSR